LDNAAIRRSPQRRCGAALRAAHGTLHVLPENATTRSARARHAHGCAIAPASAASREAVRGQASASRPSLLSSRLYAPRRYLVVGNIQLRCSRSAPCSVIGRCVTYGYLQHPFVVALPTRERPHAVGAHVAQCHRRPGLRSWSCAHAGEDSASAGRSESCRAPVRR